MNTDVIESCRFVFVSNYLNHHQIPFCNAMYELCGGSFAFIQTEPVEEERLQMGWAGDIRQSYLKLYYREEEICKRLISEAVIVMFGGCEDESYIEGRLEEGKPVLRCSERLYKTGQWKAVSPRGLKKKYHDHTRYRKAPVYLLCAGAYVPSDFSIVRAYPGKMYCWGYFPETRHYDVETLLAGKKQNSVPCLLWAARMIRWKHPELAVETARHLKEKGLAFHMEMIGGGPMEEQIRALTAKYGLQREVEFPGFLPPEQVRQRMEKADIFLLTSDREEGWGAVANEAMNSGCALLADHMTGAAPYLIRDGENGLIYRDGSRTELFSLAEKLVRDGELRAALGRNGYRTITETWNAENAAKALWELCGSLGIRGDGRDSGESGAGADASDSGEQSVSGAASDSRRYRSEGKKDTPSRPQSFVPAPCAPAQVIPERKMYALLKRGFCPGAYRKENEKAETDV